MQRTELTAGLETGARRFSPDSVWWFALYAFGVSALEVCAYTFRGAVSTVASRVWLLSGALFLVCSLRRIGSVLKRDLREHFFWGWIAALLVAGVTFWKIDSFDYHINGEAAHQVTQALGNWTLSDLNYTGCGHYSYPGRQYLLAALPAKLLGRNLLSLRLSYLWIFFLAMLVFYAGVREKLQGTVNGAYLAALAMPSLLTFPFVVLWLRQPEQAIMPLSLTAAATGWYLFSLDNLRPITALCLSWVGAMLATTYTPGLASWLMAITMLLLTGVARLRASRKNDAVLLFLATLIIASLGLASFATRGDIVLHLYQERRGSLHNIWMQVSGGYEAFFSSALFPTLSWEGHVFMSAAWLLPLSIYLLTSLVGMNGAAHFLTCAWALGVIGASVYLQGYSIAGPALELVRAMGVLPPLIAGSLIRAGELFARWRLSVRISAIAFFLVLAGCMGWNLHHSHQVFLDGKNRRSLEALQWLLVVAKEHGVVEKPIDIYIFSARYDFNVTDYVQYFFPQLQVHVRELRQCFEKFDGTRNAIILYDEDACGEQLHDIRMAYDGFHDLPVQHGLKGYIFTPRREGVSRKVGNRAPEVGDA